MANLSDYDVADVINSDENSYRGDIAERSGLQGCFLYFVDREAVAANHQQTPHRQHVEHVRTIANALGIRTALFPCIVFFRRPEFREYVYVQLHGQSASEIVSTVNGVFDSVEKNMKDHPELTPFRALQNFDKARKGQAKARGAIHLLTEIAAKRGVEIVQSIATSQQ